MAKKRSGDAVRRHARLVFPLGEFLSRLHQSIGGSGPVLGSGSKSECSAFRRDHPDHSLTAEEFRVEYLWANIMKKYDDGKSSQSRRDAALKALAEAENQCRTSYEVFQEYRRYGGQIPELPAGLTVDAVLHMASRKIAMVLGDFCWDDTLDYVGFGPGATTSLRKDRADLWYKFEAVPQASTSVQPVVEAYLQAEAPLWKRVLIERHGITYTTNDASTVTTVPKNCDTDRPIAIEPQWNMFFQKGIGGVIRERLRRVGVDLNDQTVNQRLALAGSKDGSLATIDLSSASDTVSRWVVEALLPPDWLAAMELCRCAISVLPSKEKIILEKFSSMGNGFTFELETLIFWALSSTVVQSVREDYSLKERRVSVYGDDIIVPSSCAKAVMAVLKLFGFLPNGDKSFHDGPFRESCGMHAYAGCDVTPFFIRRPVSTLEELFLLHNNLVRWSIRRYSGGRDSRVNDLCRWVRSFAPVEWRKPRLPDGYGDGAFIGSFDECTPQRHKRHPKVRSRGWCGYYVDVLAPHGVSFDNAFNVRREKAEKRTLYEGDPRLLRALWLINHQPPSQSGLRPDIPFCVVRAKGARLKTVYVWKWNELPPWIDFHDSVYDPEGLYAADLDSPVVEGGYELLAAVG